jgi:hypothetical protein
MPAMTQIGSNGIVFKSHLQNLGENGGGDMTIAEIKDLKVDLQESLAVQIDAFQKKTGLTVEEINISHNGRLAEDQVVVEVKTYL